MTSQTDPHYPGSHPVSDQVAELPAEYWVCDGCMMPVLRFQIDDMADGEHVICKWCTRDQEHRATPPENDALAESVAVSLTFTDLLTPNHDGTPDHYTVEADNVPDLVRAVLGFADEYQEQTRVIPPETTDA